MARIERSDVEETLSNNAVQKVSDSELDKSVTVGHTVVEKVDTSEYDETTLELAEAEAAAHWIVHNKTRQLSRKSVGDAQKVFGGSFGKQLEGTSHGQTLLTLIPPLKNPNHWTVTTNDV